MAKNQRQHAPRDRKRPFKVPEPPCTPKPPKAPPPPRPAPPFDSIWPDPLGGWKGGGRKKG